MEDEGKVVAEARSTTVSLWGSHAMHTMRRPLGGPFLRHKTAHTTGTLGIRLYAGPASVDIVNFLSLGEGTTGIPHTHHFGNGVKQVFTEGTVNHLHCSGGIQLHTTRSAMLVVQNGVTDAVVMETRFIVRIYIRVITQGKYDTTFVPVISNMELSQIRRFRQFRGQNFKIFKPKLWRLIDNISF